MKTTQQKMHRKAGKLCNCEQSGRAAYVILCCERQSRLCVFLQGPRRRDFTHAFLVFKLISKAASKTLKQTKVPVDPDTSLDDSEDSLLRSVPCALSLSLSLSVSLGLSVFYSVRGTLRAPTLNRCHSLPSCLTAFRASCWSKREPSFCEA